MGSRTKIIFASVLSLLVILFAIGVSAEPGAPSNTQSCGSASIIINEIDYDQPSASDSAEFIEIKGKENTTISNLELRFLNGGGNVYRSYDLSGKQLSYAGYLVIAGQDAATIPDVVLNDNAVINSQAGVGLFDTSTNTYCNFINYEGTVTSFGGWLNIGEDEDIDGEGRGCARYATGWWACNKITTPGGANSVVAVQLADSATQTVTVDSLLSVFVLLSVLCIALLRRTASPNSSC